MKPFLSRTLFFIGWVLSPFTSWNDVVVNIPIAYLCAVAARRLVPINFVSLVLVFYWLTNIVGLAMMVVGGRYMAGKKTDLKNEFYKLFLTILVYSIVVVLMGNLGILKPV